MARGLALGLHAAKQWERGSNEIIWQEDKAPLASRKTYVAYHPDGWEHLGFKAKCDGSESRYASILDRECEEVPVWRVDEEVGRGHRVHT
jgi:hypothetical protein